VVRSNQARYTRQPGDWFRPARQSTASVTQDVLNSSTSGLTLTIAGADQTNPGEVVVSNHDRIYTNSTVAVTGDTITPSPAAAAGDKVGIYYDDDARLGGAVTYEYILFVGGAGEIDILFASPDNPYRHFVALLTVGGTGSSSGGSGTGTGTGGTGGPGGGLNPPNEA
jgi:hypothetical protein